MATHVVRRLYLYAAAFIGLHIAAAGARQAIAALVERVFWPGTPGSTEFNVAWLSSSVALLVVGLPLWGIHWYVAQRGRIRPEEQRSTLRRLYGYAILLVAMLGLLFAARRLLLALFGVEDWDSGASTTAAALAAVIVHAAVWGYHWRVFNADRDASERTGGTATLRRWYLLLVQAFGLSMASYAAADLLH